jgi:KDO2-lipid IV(A) lauroyltransferase
MPSRRRIVERNLRRIHGPERSQKAIDREVTAVFDSYARYWLESFRLPGTHPAIVEDGFAVEGYEHVDAALDKGGGVILALPHLGGWEWAAFWLAVSKGVQVTAVAEPVEPPELAEWFVGLRREIGIDVVPLGPSAAAECMRALKANHILCLLCDRDLAGTGVEVDFFGERTTIPGGPATLALRSGAPLLPTAVYFDGDKHLGVVRPPLPVERGPGRLREDVGRITQDIAGELEALIRRAPDQWHLMQPNWPSDRE